MTGEVRNLFTCVCGDTAKPRAMMLSETETDRHKVTFQACDACVARVNNFLVKVRPVFDKMIEIGVPREIANDVMSELLARLPDDSMLEAK